MIVIGVDTHKRSHTLVALDAATGATRGQLRIAATDDGTLEARRFAAELDDARVWAVEDCRHVSGRLERGLLAGGEEVVRVAPGLTETSRRAVPEAGKSDPIDATAIARAALREGIDTLPVAHLVGIQQWSASAQGWSDETARSPAPTASTTARSHPLSDGFRTPAGRVRWEIRHPRVAPACRGFARLRCVAGRPGAVAFCIGMLVAEVAGALASALAFSSATDGAVLGCAIAVTLVLPLRAGEQ